MDEIENRLREASEACIAFYLAWRGDEYNSDTREKLQDSIHELRKITSRLEIEMAISEREEMASKPIPIPPHRAKRERGGNNFHHDDDTTGNLIEPEPHMGGGESRGAPQIRRSRRRPQRSED